MEKLERLVDSSNQELAKKQPTIPEKLNRLSGLVTYTSLFLTCFLLSLSPLIYEWSYQRSKTRYLLEQG